MGQSGQGQKMNEQFSEMQSELDFKNRQLQNSETTHQRLQAELDKRTGELEKINSLDLKISTELEQLEGKTAQFQHEIANKFDKIGEMKQEWENQIRLLSQKKLTVEGRAAVLREQVSFLRLRYESKKQELADNETHLALEASESKIKLYEQNLFHLRSFIAAKVSETEYEIPKGAALDAAEQINQILQAQLHNLGGI